MNNSKQKGERHLQIRRISPYMATSSQLLCLKNIIKRFSGAPKNSRCGPKSVFSSQNSCVRQETDDVVRDNNQCVESYAYRFIVTQKISDFNGNNNLSSELDKILDSAKKHGFDIGSLDFDQKNGKLMLSGKRISDKIFFGVIHFVRNIFSGV